ncbi:MAG: hypothetical protein ABIU05_09310 [Nitrospirales bacterium]
MCQLLRSLLGKRDGVWGLSWHRNSVGADGPPVPDLDTIRVRYQKLADQARSEQAGVRATTGTSEVKHSGHNGPG